MSLYGICEYCAARGGLIPRESRRERLWLTTDYRRLCRYHYEEYVGNTMPSRIINRAAQDIPPDDCCTIEALENKLDIDD